MAVAHSLKKKERLLLLLEGGKTLSEVCKQLKVSRTSYYTWCRKDPRFKGRADVARKTGQELRAAGDGPVGEDDKFQPGDDWREVFVDAYVRTCGVVSAAARRVDRDTNEIYHMLNPKHPLYDEVLDQMMQRAEGSLERVWLDEARTKAKAGDAKLTEKVLGWLNPDKYADKRDPGKGELDIRVTIERQMGAFLGEIIDTELVEGVRELHGGADERLTLPGAEEAL